jgi:hypothetical protein
MCDEGLCWLHYVHVLLLLLGGLATTRAPLFLLRLSLLIPACQQVVLGEHVSEDNIVYDSNTEAITHKPLVVLVNKHR